MSLALKEKNHIVRIRKKKRIEVKVFYIKKYCFFILYK